MKTPFAIGDRVRVIAGFGVGEDGRHTWITKSDAVILSTVYKADDSKLFVQLLHKKEKTNRVYVGAMSCRRLVKKPRRRVWINGESVRALNRVSVVDATISVVQTIGDDIEFIEVKSKKSVYKAERGE